MRRFNSIINSNYFYFLVCFIIFGFYLSLNGFSALYTSDSGAYLLNSRELKIPGDRSIFYSLFICFLNYFSNSILLIQLFYNYFIFVLLMNNLINLYPSLKNKSIYLFVCFSVCTPTIWLFTQIMPDFSLILEFIIFIIILKSKLNKSILFLYTLLFIIELTLHNSNPIIFILFGFLLIIGTSIISKLRLYRKKLIYLTGLSMVGLMLIISTNLYAGNGITIGKSSKIFFMGKLCENGVLNSYLNETCNKHPNALCEFKNNLPSHAWDFVWEENGAFQKSGGWDHSDSLYKQIINDILFNPHFASKFIKASIHETFKQIFLNGAGDGMSKMDSTKTLAQELKKYHSTDYSLFMIHSNQQKEKINFGIANDFYLIMQYTIFIFCILLIIIFKNINHIKLLIFALLFHIINAAFTGSFVNIINRLNTRSMIAVELICLFIIFDIIPFKRKTQV